MLRTASAATRKAVAAKVLPVEAKLLPPAQLAGKFVLPHELKRSVLGCGLDRESAHTSGAP